MTGHRPSYLRRIVNVSLAHNYRVIVGMPTPCFDHQVVKEIFEKHDTDRLSALRYDGMDRISEPKNPLFMLLNEYRCVRFYKSALRKAQVQQRIDMVLIGMLDDAAIFAGITGLTFGAIPRLGIVMRQNFHLNQMGAYGPAPSKQRTIKKRLFVRLLRRAKKNTLVLTIDKLLLQYVTRIHPEVSSSLGHIPDAVDDRVSVTNPNIRQELGIPQSALVILVYGALRDNKGVKLLVNAMHSLPANTHVMLAGNQDSDIEQYLEQKRNKDLITAGRLHEVNRYIDVSEDANFFSASDIIWLGYKDYYSMSAVLVQAAQYHRPSLATNTGLVAWLTNKHKTGIVIDVSDQHEIVGAINDMANGSKVPANAQYDALVEEHSLATFETAMISAFNKIIV